MDPDKSFEATIAPSIAAENGVKGIARLVSVSNVFMAANSLFASLIIDVAEKAIPLPK